MKEVIAVIGKRPCPGFSKTRLEKDLGPARAQELYQSFILEFLQGLKENIGNRVFYFFGTPDEEETKSYFQEIFTHLKLDSIFLFQPDLPFFKRLESLFSTILEKEGDCLVHLTGTDIPDFPFSVLSQVHGLRVFIGPDEDQGFYYVAAKASQGKIFQIKKFLDKKYSVLEALEASCQEQSLSTIRLQTWSDIDTYKDYQRYLERKRKA